jgi:hypothetical protein
VLTLADQHLVHPAYGLGLLWMACGIAVIALLFVGGLRASGSPPSVADAAQP